AGQVQNTIEDLKASLIGKNGAASKNAPRFLMSTDGDEFLAVDIKTGETPSFDRLADLAVNYDFLLPMFGVERYKPAPETAADVRAARHMAKFHDAIRDANPTWGAERVHDLNIFMTRLLFCMFAEDTGIFSEKLFVNTLRREAMQIDGSDTQRVIEDIFLSLDVADKDARLARGVRSQRVAADFPYVNGGLFRDRTEIPVFNRRARRLLLEAADLHWDQIHADIFGSMIQAIIHTDMRADFGMHYTSVPNIMKVLEPLFLNSLRDQLTLAGDNIKALEKLVNRIALIRVFDPACGSGNFLIIAYRELRLIETEAFRRMRDVKRKGQLALADYQTGIRISNFYGIDPVDFACETAKLSLWISQYQMNRKLDEICSAPTPALPLTDAGSIMVGNALREDWSNICPPSIDDETYIVGNPPYLGSTYQEPDQKEDMKIVFGRYTKTFKNLDYVSAWFMKSAEYSLKNPLAASFVSTNSICQGEQVAMLWPLLFERGVEIGFAYESFKWRNNAAKNAAVTCVIIGIRSNVGAEKRLYGHESSRTVSNIGPYLIAMGNQVVTKHPKPISELKAMDYGCKPADDGGLLFDSSELTEMLANDASSQLCRRAWGSHDFINGKPRGCIWIGAADYEAARTKADFVSRFEKVRAFRALSTKKPTRDMQDKPYAFTEIYGQAGSSEQEIILIPRHMSERREYLPIGYVGARDIVLDSAFAVYDAPTWNLAVLVSKMHATWTKAVAGRIKTDLRYSNTLVYNTFPVPPLSIDQKAALEEHALNILRLREQYIADGKSLAWLYNPETMPEILLQAHRELDDYFEAIYIGRAFYDDTERLEHLFKLYARMTKKAAKAD
ncbi:MAG: N-6 DNA methylase, partial [Cyanobacteria bacterium]|nr:N-6 DNA methylase [Cyanobacteriota bacterium]